MLLFTSPISPMADYQATEDEIRRSKEREPGLFEGMFDAVGKGVEHAWAAQKIIDYGATRENIAELNATRINPANTGMISSIANSLVQVTAAGAMGIPKYAVAGTAMGATVGAAASPYVAGAGALPGAVAGFGIGAKFGFITNAGRLQGISQYYYMKQQGVDDNTAMKTAILSGLMTSVGVSLPGAVGGTLLKQSASGAAINVASGGIERKSISATLKSEGYQQLSEQYKFFDANAVAAEVFLGAILPIGRRALNKTLGPVDIDTDVDIQAYKGAIETLHQHEAALHSPIIPTDLESNQNYQYNFNAHAKAIEEGRTLDPAELRPIRSMDNPKFDAQQKLARQAWEEVILESTGRNLVDYEGMVARMSEADIEVSRLNRETADVIANEAIARQAETAGEIDFMMEETKRLANTIADMEITIGGETAGMAVKASELVEQLSANKIRTEQDTNLHQILIACEVTHA